MSIIANEFDNDININDEVNSVTEYELNLTYLSALETLDDLEKLENLELALLTTESGEAILHHLQLAGFDLNDELTSETAIAGRTGILAKISDIKNKMEAANDEIKTPLGKLFDNLFVGINSLKKLKEQLESGNYVMRDKAGFFQRGSSDVISKRVGLLLGLGLDPNKPDNIIKLLGMPKMLATTVLKENFKLMDAMQDGIVKNPESFMKMIEEGRLQKATESIKFINSLKGLDIKDLNVIAGFPTKVFSPYCSTIILHIEDGKIKVESDASKFGKFTLNPQTNISDMIKIVDAAIKEFTAIKSEANNIKNMVNNSSRFKDLLVNQGSGMANPLVTFSKIIRYKQNLLRAAINLQYDFSEIVLFTKSYINVMTKKK